MTQLSKSAFSAKWAARFPDNTTGEITEGDLREFVDDVKDSFLPSGDTALLAGKFKGIYVHGPKEADTFWLYGKAIWRTKSAFNSNAVPVPGPWWELALEVKLTFAQITGDPMENPLLQQLFNDESEARDALYQTLEGQISTLREDFETDPARNDKRVSPDASITPAQLSLGTALSSFNDSDTIYIGRSGNLFPALWSAVRQAIQLRKSEVASAGVTFSVVCDQNKFIDLTLTADTTISPNLALSKAGSQVTIEIQPTAFFPTFSGMTKKGTGEFVQNKAINVNIDYRSSTKIYYEIY